MHYWLYFSFNDKMPGMVGRQKNLYHYYNNDNGKNHWYPQQCKGMWGHLNSHDGVALPMDHFVHGTEAATANLTKVTKVIRSKFNLLQVR